MLFGLSEHVPPQLGVQLHFLYGEAEDDGLQEKALERWDAFILLVRGK